MPPTYPTDLWLASSKTSSWGVGQSRTAFGQCRTPQEEPTSMAKQKRATATVKMTYKEDADLIAWWNSIPRGTRNAVMKDLMREYIERHRGSYRPVLPRNVPQPFDPSRFAQICDDTAWIRTALLDLPGYMEQVLQQVTTILPAGHSPTGMSVLPAAGVSDEAAQRREQHVKKAQW